MTSTSGPGLALKSETISLAFMTELPLIVIDVQRAGPSTGMPTRVEQSDLLFAMYGRHGEAPLPVIAALTPSDSFATAMEAVRIATKFMTPVILLSDGYVANSSEPWLLPDVDTLPRFPVQFATEPNDGDVFLPYLRDSETGARPWALPSTPGLQHRVGGLEKQNLTGNVDYDSENHALMTALRARKIDAIAEDIPDLEVYGDADAGLLVLGWGSTFGAIRAGTIRARDDGLEVAHVQLKYLNPFPSNLGELLEGRGKILVPELNSGQLAKLIRAEFLVETETFSKIEGDPFKAVEIEDQIRLASKELA